MQEKLDEQILKEHNISEINEDFLNIAILDEIGELTQKLYDKKQLKRILALNQLLNIAEYYNRLHTTNIEGTTIMYDKSNKKILY